MRFCRVSSSRDHYFLFAMNPKDASYSKLTSRTSYSRLKCGISECATRKNRSIGSYIPVHGLGRRSPAQRRRVLVDTTRNECAPTAECNSVLAVEIRVDPTFRGERAYITELQKKIREPLRSILYLLLPAKQNRTPLLSTAQFHNHLVIPRLIHFMMLFQRSANTILNLSRNMARRAKSTTSSTAATAESVSAGGLVVAVGTTFGTYMIADFLSNFIQHPTQKVRGGSLVAEAVLISLLAFRTEFLMAPLDGDETTNY